MDLNADEIRALLQAGGYRLLIYDFTTVYSKGWWEAVIYYEDLPQSSRIRSPSKETAVQVAYNLFIGETK